MFDFWTEVARWATRMEIGAGERFELGPLGPRPRKVFGIGTTFHGYLEQARRSVPEVPLASDLRASAPAHGLSAPVRSASPGRWSVGWIGWCPAAVVTNRHCDGWSSRRISLLIRGHLVAARGPIL
ncbi:hypothetical protein GCM10017691_38100 [Pseudonocardia petroleophila]